MPKFMLEIEDAAKKGEVDIRYAYDPDFDVNANPKARPLAHSLGADVMKFIHQSDLSSEASDTPPAEGREVALTLVQELGTHAANPQAVKQIAQNLYSEIKTNWPE